jgi:hypothetical protein
MMTDKIYTETRLDSKPLVIGAGVLADVRRRVRELENRLPSAMTATNRRELAKLKEFLQSMEGDHENPLPMHRSLCALRLPGRHRFALGTRSWIATHVLLSDCCWLARRQ